MQVLIFIALAAHLLTAPALAAAAPMPAPGTLIALAAPAPPPAAPTHAPVVVSGQRLFDVGGLPGQSAAERAALINRRVDSFVRHPERIAPIEVQMRGAERVLAIRGRDLLTVTPQDADDNLTTVPELAQSWARELDETLSAIRLEHETLWNQVSLTIVNSTENLLRQAAALIPRLLSALLVLLLTLLLACGARAGVRRVLRHPHIDPNTRELVRTLTYYGVWVVGWIVALGALGINPATLVAGLGVTTIALGFALKDLLSNFVSGFLILTTRPFSLGDQIAVKEFEGTVERIELRATHLRTYDNRLVIIPNADLYIATITNNTASPYRRQEFPIGVGYEADLDQVSTLARQVMAETPGVLAEPAPDLLVDELGPDSVNLKLRFHTDSRRGNAVTVGSAVRRRVKEAFDAAGIELYPSGPQTVQLIGPKAAAPASQPAEGVGPHDSSAPPGGGAPTSAGREQGAV